MAEYLGYVSSGFVDWSGIAKGLQENVNKGLQARQKKIDEDNKLFDDTKKKLGEYENTQSPSYNNRAYQLTSSARTQLSDWQKQLRNGEITRDQFKINSNTLYEQYDSFINTSKQFDQYISEVNKKIQSGEAGAEFVAKANANMAFMGLADGSAELQVGKDGGIYVSKDGEPISIKQWTNIQNLSDGKIDVNEQVSKFTDKVATVYRSSTAASGASVTTEDARQMKEQYDAIKNNAIATVANRNNPSSIVSILMDNSDLGYQIFMSKNDIQNAVQNAVQKQEIANGEGVSLTEDQKKQIQSEIESKAIMYTPSGDGSLNPVLTDKMILDAEKVAGEFFEAQIDSKITTEAAQAYRGGGGRSGGGGSEDEVTKAGWQLSMDAINNTPVGATSASDASGILTQLGAKNPKLLFKKVKWKNNKTGIAVFEQNSKGEWESKQNILNSRDLAPYIFGTSNVDKALTSWDKANQTYGGGQTKGGTKPKAY
jgi:hypothetical protein